MELKNHIGSFLCLIVLLTFFGCGSDGISVVSQITETICDDFIIRDECLPQLDEADKNPVSLLDSNTVVIIVSINACTELAVDFVKQKSDKVVIKLSEDGMECTGGGDLVKLELGLNQSVSLDYLEVYKDNELVFPIE